MNTAFPETPEAVAWELTLAISEAEGRPIRRRRQQQGNRGMNQPARSYILNLFTECLIASRGSRENSGATMMH